MYDLRLHDKGTVEIGNYCWIDMNSVILPGVKLGPHAIVGANSIVTKSFENGYCVIAGNPTHKIKDLEKEKCIDFDYPEERIGYIKAERFDKYRQKNYIFEQQEYSMSSIKANSTFMMVSKMSKMILDVIAVMILSRSLNIEQ